MEKYREYEAFLDAKEKELGLSIDDKATGLLLKLDYLISEMEMQKAKLDKEQLINAKYNKIKKKIEAAL